MSRIATTILSLLATAGGLAAAEGTTPAAPAATPYPLNTCIVSGEALGSMGEAISLVEQGREVKFCCKGCIKAFKKDPATFLAKLPAASATAAPVK